MDWQQIAPQLAAKLDPAHVRPAKSFGPKGDYIEGWHAIAEANRIFGFGAWSYVVVTCACVHQGPREIGQAKKPGFGVSYTATIRVTVGDVTRDDVGAGHGYDVDCGLAHESAIKEAVTDALKRALRTFGNPFGLALYDKSRENVGSDAPTFDPVACAGRIKAGIAKRKTKQELTEYWSQEGEALASLKAADAGQYQSVRDAFADAAKKAIDDPARQSPHPEQETA